MLLARLARLGQFGYYLFVAAIALFGFGSGTIIGDGQAELHVDPLKFVQSLTFAWDPMQFLGRHTGFSHVYEMPYSWLYALLQVLHIEPTIAQRLVMFLLYLAIASSMGFCLRSFDEGLPSIAVAAGATAYSLNIYVAFNSQGSIPMLLTYATLPSIAAAVFLVSSGRWSITRGASAVAFLTVVAGGVNPPLIAINLVVIALLFAVLLFASPERAIAFRRLCAFGSLALLATVAVSAYWIAPFLDYIRTAWVGGILIEPASMHNASTSFVNVFRGLGQWAIFVSDKGRPYYPWAPSYESGFFAALLWLVPVCAIGAIGWRRNHHWRTLYFLCVVIVSLPLVVGYYHDQLGDSFTTPIYDLLYRRLPGFQMFRAAYKWVSTYEFGTSGLFAYAVAAIQQRVGSAKGRGWAGLARISPAVLVAVPIIAYAPVAFFKANYPMLPLPPWQRSETAFVGHDASHRVAIFPTQYLETFRWGAPSYSIENSLVDRPMIIGYLGDAPQSGSDRWIKGGYRLARLGSPVSRSMFDVMNVDTILERNDADADIDFSFPGESVQSNVRLTGDIIRRVLKAQYVGSDDVLDKYRNGGALPLFYDVYRPYLSSDPAFEIADLDDTQDMAKGHAVVSPVNWDADIAEISPHVDGSSSAQYARDVTLQRLKGAIVLHPGVDAVRLTIKGLYRVFVRFIPRYVGDDRIAESILLGGHRLKKRAVGAFEDYGTSVGSGHEETLVIPGCSSSCEAWFVPEAVFKRSFARATQDLSALHHVSFESRVLERRAVVYLPAGRYEIAASAAAPEQPVQREHQIPLASLRPDPIPFRGLSTDDDALPLIPSDDVREEYYQSYPQDWFENPKFYNVVGFGQAPWTVVNRNSRFVIFLPGERTATATFSADVSAQMPMSSVTMSIPGMSEHREPVFHASRPFGPEGALSHPYPVHMTANLLLAPGWNDLSLSFSQATSGAGDKPFFWAGLAPDTSVNLDTWGKRGLENRRAKLLTFSFPRFPMVATGDPHLVGTDRSGTSRAWIAAETRCDGRSQFRLYPVALGGFDVDLLGGLPISHHTCQLRAVWLVAQSDAANASTLTASEILGNSALVQMAEPDPNPTLLLDGKPIPAHVQLAAGRHAFSFAQPVRIRNLLIRPYSSARRATAAVSWIRRSPVDIEARIPGARGWSFLVFGESYHPEWTATCGGTKLLHVIVDGFANGWLVPRSCARGGIHIFFTGQRVYNLSIVLSIVSTIVLGVSAFRSGGKKRAL